MTTCRTTPCPTCPYRRDVPAGIWDASEYAKLVDYDEPTAEQPLAAFHCHSNPEKLCAGWATCHQARGRQHELISLRLHWPTNGIPGHGVPLFDSGSQAAAHGLSGIKNPDRRARQAIAKVEHLLLRSR